MRRSIGIFRDLIDNEFILREIVFSNKRLICSIIFTIYRSQFSFKNLTADCYEGTLTGKLELKLPTSTTWEYVLQAGFNDVNLQKFLVDREPNAAAGNGHTKGKMSGSLAVRGQINNGGERFGEDGLRVIEGSANESDCEAEAAPLRVDDDAADAAELAVEGACAGGDVIDGCVAIV